MDPRQPGLKQAFEAPEAFFMDVLGRPVYGDTLQIGKNLSGKQADFAKIVGLHGNGVSGREKKSFYFPAIDVAGLEDIGLDFSHIPHRVPGAFFIDHAKSTAVVRAADRGLNQQRVGLAWRAIYGAFVTHMNMDANIDAYRNIACVYFKKSVIYHKTNQKALLRLSFED